MPLFSQSIGTNPFSLEDVIKKLEKMPDALKGAIQNTVLKTVVFTKKEIPRLITERYDISEASLMDQTRRAKFTMRAKYVRVGGYILNGVVNVRGTRMPAMRFNVHPRYVPNQRGIPVSARQTVSVMIRRGTSQVGEPNLFIARMKSGHIGVFRRKPNATHRTRPDGQRTQLNITEEYMISVPEMLAAKEIKPKLQNSIAKFMRVTFREETKGKGMRFKG